ncbi:MAG: hypothetical protein ACRC1T_13415 [Clostridium chrysemydis]|uniref:hypothetical protein n=1 Tax=Clostridium chrysemydis TaxID=2665504 RepID=UPI003F2FC79D
MKNFINLNTHGDTLTITSEMKNFISKEVAEYMYYMNSQILDNNFFNYELEKIILNIADANLNTIDSQVIISQMKSILCSSLSTEIINTAKIHYKELLAINNSSNSKAIDAIYSKIQVNSDGTINADSITIEDLQLLTNIVITDTSSVLINDASNLIEVIKTYKKF